MIHHTGVANSSHGRFVLGRSRNDMQQPAEKHGAELNRGPASELPARPLSLSVSSTPRPAMVKAKRIEDEQVGIRPRGPVCRERPKYD